MQQTGFVVHVELPLSSERACAGYHQVDLQEARAQVAPGACLPCVQASWFSGAAQLARLQDRNQDNIEAASEKFKEISRVRSGASTACSRTPETQT